MSDYFKTNILFSRFLISIAFPFMALEYKDGLVLVSYGMDFTIV